LKKLICPLFHIKALVKWKNFPTVPQSLKLFQHQLQLENPDKVPERFHCIQRQLKQEIQQFIFNYYLKNNLIFCYVNIAILFGFNKRKNNNKVV
jgi:hypothetical protein